jgi:hypothetical protein
MSYLNEKAVEIESLGETVEIRELPATAQLQIMESQDVPFEGMFIACKYGVKAWVDKPLDEIKDMLSLRQVGEISSAVLELSGFDEKNFESDPSEDSSLD